MRRATAGFTLLEMMIVVAIMGVLAALAFPSFRYLTSTTKVKGASTELYLALIRARNEAVKRNRPVTLTRSDANWQDGWRIIADTNNDGDFADADDRVVMETGAQARVTITSDEAGVVFLPSGRTQNSDTIKLTITSAESASTQRCVTADLTGKPYTKEGACT